MSWGPTGSHSCKGRGPTAPPAERRVPSAAWCLRFPCAASVPGVSSWSRARWPPSPGGPRGQGPSTLPVASVGGRGLGFGELAPRGRAWLETLAPGGLARHPRPPSTPVSPQPPPL